jgi:crossover junction endodeoxyribonuclease RuvC
VSEEVDVLAMGLDLSTVATGVARVWGETRTIKPKATSKEPARRLQEIVYRLDAWLAMDKPDVAVIEGYSPGGPGGPWTMLRLGELGGAIRVRLFEHDIPFVEVAPSSLKHFATGNGKASKADMVEAAQYRGAGVANDNEADAWHLRRVALAFYSGEEVSPAIRALPWPSLERSSSTC